MEAQENGEAAPFPRAKKYSIRYVVYSVLWFASLAWVPIVIVLMFLEMRYEPY